MNEERQGKARPPVRWERGAAIIICLFAALATVWLSFRYAWGILLPFLVAWLLSRLLRPPVDLLSRRLGVPRGLAAFALVLLSVGGGGALLVSGVRRAWQEITALAERLTADSGGLLAVLDGALAEADSLTARIPWLRGLRDTPAYADLCARIDALAETAIARLGEKLTETLPSVAMRIAELVPTVFVFATVTLLAAYYFTADNGSISRALTASLRLLPPPLADRLPPLARRIGRLLRGYVRAYLLLGLLTFLQCFIGLAILRVPYAFVLALIIALVDLLPLLGTGVVLVPWAIISLLSGNISLAIGLSVLFAVTVTVRQLLEPRLVGDGLGLHPLLSILAMYAGLRLFGVPGMLVAPLLAACVKCIFEE